MKQAIVYIRVSTKRQSIEGMGLAAQCTRAQAWCEYSGYTMTAVYIERGTSGRRADNRPALREAIAALGSGNALVVYSLSRLARSLMDACHVLIELEAIGADFVSATENLDTTSSAGKLLFHILSAFAEFESDQISDRVLAAFEQCRATGRAHCAQPVYGFDHVPVQIGDKVKYNLEPNATELAVIQDMRDMRAAGISYGRIADKLNNDHVPTKRGGVAWYACGVRSILQNKLHDKD